MNEIEMASPSRRAVVYGLAATGFIALVALGIWLAVYSARYIPRVVSTLGTAAVSLSQVFTPGNPSLEVVGTSTTPATIEFGNATASTTGATGSGGSSGSRGTPAGGDHTPGTPSGGTYPIPGSGTGTGGTLSGFGDLTIEIDAIGYLAAGTTESFTATSTVPSGFRPAVRFTVRNSGTNVIPPVWRFSAIIPTRTSYTFQSAFQQQLNPGDNIEYTLGFDQPASGTQTITITVNPDKNVQESNFNNNTATASLTIH